MGLTLAATAMPATNPPPLTEAMIASSSGTYTEYMASCKKQLSSMMITCSSSSMAMVPCPAMMSGWLEEGMSTALGAYLATREAAASFRPYARTVLGLGIEGSVGIR